MLPGSPDDASGHTRLRLSGSRFPSNSDCLASSDDGTLTERIGLGRQDLRWHAHRTLLGLRMHLVCVGRSSAAAHREASLFESAAWRRGRPSHCLQDVVGLRDNVKLVIGTIFFVACKLS